MAIPQKIENRTKALISEINDSSIPLALKDNLREILLEAKEGTNGLDVEAKTQNNACAIANCTYLLIRHILENELERTQERAPNWKAVVKDCAWQITIVLIGLFALIAIHPELGGLLTQLK